MERSVARLKEIDGVFAEALDLAPVERMALLARMEGDDPALAVDVSDLLRLAEQPDSRLTPQRVLAGPFWCDWLDRGDLLAPDTVAAGERIGAWRVLGELGRGGMATVLLAERADGAFQHRVALKLLRGVGGGAGGEEAMRRFAQERQILATLNHPSIGGSEDLKIKTHDGDSHQRNRFDLKLMDVEVLHHFGFLAKLPRGVSR